MSTTIDPAVVRAALAQSRYFAGERSMDILTPYLVKLPDIIGPERIEERVTLAAYLEVIGGLLRSMLDHDLGLEHMVVGTVMRQLVESLEHTDPAELLAAEDMTEEEAMLHESTDLTPAARELYLAGELTFAKMAELSPGSFIPQDHLAT